MTDDSSLIAIEIYRGVPITLNRTTGNFQATVQRGGILANTLQVLRRCIEQSLLLEQELQRCQHEEMLYE